MIFLDNLAGTDEEEEEDESVFFLEEYFFAFCCTKWRFPSASMVLASGSWRFCWPVRDRVFLGMSFLAGGGCVLRGRWVVW